MREKSAVKKARKENGFLFLNLKYFLIWPINMRFTLQIVAEALEFAKAVYIFNK